MSAITDPNEAYRQTQSQIYRLQETILNSSRNRPSSEGRKEQGEDHAEKQEYGHYKTEENQSSVLKKHSFIDRSVTVDSNPALNYVDVNYSSQRRHLGTLYYHLQGTGSFDENSLETEELSFPYDSISTSVPPPFLPLFTNNEINCLLTIKLSYEDIQTALGTTTVNHRVQNNEVWGTEIYTDDSDILLVLRHCGVIPSANSKTRTPANISNCDQVSGVFPPGNAPYDLSVDILLLPPLQKYTSTERHGIHSREWDTWHDGLSFGVYSVVVTPRDTSTTNIATGEQLQTIKW